MHASMDGYPFLCSRETRIAISDALGERNPEGPYKTMDDLKEALDA